MGASLTDAPSVPSLARGGVALRRVATVIGWSIAAIELHELAHLAAYRMLGVPAHLGFQRVDPLVHVEGAAHAVALLAGPLASLVAAAVFLAIARRRGGFFWATAAFTNATLRLFPLAMDIARSVRGGVPFSDEAAAASMLFPRARLAVVLVWLAACSLLGVAAAREYRFARRGVLKCAGIYLLSLAVGIGAVLLDDIFGARGM